MTFRMWIILHGNNDYLVKIITEWIVFLSDDWTWWALILATNYARLGTSSWREEFSRSISVMHMAPSARMQLSSNSRWVMVALDWEDTKVNKDTQKTAEKLMKGIVSSVQQTLDTDTRNRHTKEMVFWRCSEQVGLSVAFCQPGDSGSDLSSNSGIFSLSIAECSTSLCRTQSRGYQSLQPYLWPCRD